VPDFGGARRIISAPVARAIESQFSCIHYFIPFDSVAIAPTIERDRSEIRVNAIVLSNVIVTVERIE
jgi:hypothetical protein